MKRHKLLCLRQEESGYTLIWVLLVSVILVTLVSAAMYAESYGVDKTTTAFRNDTSGQYGSDVSVQTQYPTLRSDIMSFIAGQGKLTSATDVGKATSALVVHLSGENYPVVATGSYTDLSGGIHEELRVTGTGGAAMNLDLVFGSSSSGGSAVLEQNPYPYSTNSTHYVFDPNATTQSQVTVDNDNGATPKPYILDLASRQGDTPGDVKVSGNSYLPYGDSKGSMAELVAGNVDVAANSGLTVNGSLVASTITLESDASMHVTGDVIASKLVVQSNSRLTIDGQLSIGSATAPSSGTSSSTTGSASNAVFDADSNESITVSGKAVIVGGMYISSNGGVTFQDNLYETGNVEVSANSGLHVVQSADLDGSVSVDANAHFTTDGNLCISGSLSLNANSGVKVGQQALIKQGVTQQANSTYSAGMTNTTGTCPLDNPSGYTLSTVTEV